MIIPEQFRSYLFPNSRWLPAIDWNIKLFGAHTQEVPKGWAVPEEAHIAFEIMLILKGSQRTVLENIVYDLHQGDILLIPPGTRHIVECVVDQGLSYFSSHFNLDDPMFRQEMSRSGQIFFPAGSEDNQRLREAMMRWVNLIQGDEQYTTADLFRIQSGLFEILNILAQHVTAKAETAVSPTVVHYATLIAQSIKSQFNSDVIQKELLREKEIRIEDIAVKLKISPGYALEVFQKVYGISPRKYLSELKLHEAKQLIQQPDLDLTRIASMLGYSSLAHFSRQFKRWTGMSPREYRQTLGSIRFF
ncbi:AraC family transcriptional regulator [Paenibacillus sp. JX-17]|uniref:AraC family transcriptional regulator n=1 Tax=Paenibacillus lacisoli TaxID=3064525 RepID=A0ABT9CFD4_9BACL|nr:AraC family transcriptional regulator [Paenibacillus sp. JX-17]MDO7907985.1 AraC family transcriptional regulator [Paenibacillus sp. JX-17]